MFPDQITWGDPADITRWLDCLRQKLRTGHSDVNEDLLEAAIEDALVHYWRHPQCFDASRGYLSCYLWWRARHYLDKQFQKEQCHRRHEKAAGVSDRIFEKKLSGMRVGRGIYIGRDESEEEAEERGEVVEGQREILDAILERLDPRDQTGARLLRAGVARQKWVRHLEIENVPHQKQQRKIDAEKDRLRKILKRRAQKMQGGGRSPYRTQVWATCFDASGERESWLISSAGCYKLLFQSSQ